MSERDSRIDPRVGDWLAAHGAGREIVGVTLTAIIFSRQFGWKKYTRNRSTFLKWASGATVVNAKNASMKAAGENEPYDPIVLEQRDSKDKGLPIARWPGVLTIGTKARTAQRDKTQGHTFSAPPAIVLSRRYVLFI